MADIDAKTIAAAATLAKIPALKQRAFASSLISAVREAHRPARGSYHLSDVLPYFVDLRAALNQMSLGHDGAVAGGYLQIAIAPYTLEELIERVEAAEGIARKRLPVKGAPRGSRNTPGFDAFVQRTVIPTYIFGGKFMCYRDNGAHGDGKARGSFPLFLNLLSGHLPEGFIPKSGAAIVKAFKIARDA